MWALEFRSLRVSQICDVHPQKLTHQAPYFKLEAAVWVVAPGSSALTSLCIESKGIKISEKSSRLTEFGSHLMVGVKQCHAEGWLQAC